MTRTMTLYGNRVFGETVSNYGLENGYLDYYTLSKIVGDRILNNDILVYTGFENWDLYNGLEDDEDCDKIYQYYIISDNGAKFLEEYTNEIMFYNEGLDLYLWGITHFGTSWDYVLTDIELIGE